jgi:N-acetylmuramoyl-L-alanine amidase
MRIALDAGHGMKTAGKRCLKSIDPNETREWWLNQRIATKVENKLKAYDNVETIRVDDITGDVDVKLGDRCKKANDWKADVYCSFHHNAGINGGAGGGLVVITYDDSKASQDIRNSLYDSLIDAGLMKGNRSNPKVSNKSLYVLNSTKMPAVLVEHDFMDSTTATPIILTEEFAEKAANGWIKWFEDFYGIKKSGNPDPQPTPEPQPTPQPVEEGYKVKVTASALNIRDKAGYAGKVVGVIRDKGVYTIVDEQNVAGVKWGKLKSGAGWISLKFTKRI